MRPDMADQMVCSIIMAFTEATLKIASILGLDGGLGRVERVDGGRGVIKHGGGEALGG